MDRRSFLVGASGLAASAGLTGCSGQNQISLRVRLLKGSIPAQLPSEFHKHLPNLDGVALDFKPTAKLQDLFTLLQTWKQQANQLPSQGGFTLPFSVPFVYDKSAAAVPDLVTLGDYWLAIAIRQQLIQPLNNQSWQQWQQIPQSWRRNVTRNAQGQVDAKGKIWAAPYRWGSTVIAYNQTIFKQKNLQPPTDWGDLWRPELKGRISLLDQPREVIGLTLKKLGASYNTVDLESITQLDAELKRLHQQVKVYSSEYYLQSLILGDTWVAVGWSTDVLTSMRQNPAIAAIIPSSGTALWSDLWVQPSVTAPTSPDLVAKWIDFCWNRDTAVQLAVVSQAASPILPTLDRATLPQAVQTNPILLPSAEILSHSEFLEPLPETTVDQYRLLWKTLRRKS